MPLSPASNLRHVSSLLRPNGESIPRPVTTTRRFVTKSPRFGTKVGDTKTALLEEPFCRYLRLKRLC